MRDFKEKTSSTYIKQKCKKDTVALQRKSGQDIAEQIFYTHSAATSL